MSETMLRGLSRYYEDNGVLSTSFTCPHKKDCKGDCAEFTGPKSAFVSTGYERGNGKLPRLLFLSLDSGDGDENAENRLPEAVREQEEVKRDILSLPKNRHWYRTHELAWYVFRQFDSGIGLEEARKHFAHANSAKCCMNKPGRKKAAAVLFRNCRKYLRGELEILRPDVLITQGTEAKEAVKSLIKSLDYKVLKNIDGYASKVEMDGREVFWLHTYHPACWGRFNGQRDFDGTRGRARGWEKYSRMIREFWNGRGET